MNHAWVYGRTAEAYDNQPRNHTKMMRQRHKHNEDTGQYQYLAEADHNRVLESHGQEAGKRAAHSNAYIE